MIFGLDYLAGAKYGKIILKEHPVGWGAGFFANTFGDAFPVVKALASRGIAPIIRIHLLWSDTHSFGDKDIKTIVKEARKYKNLVTSSSIELSPFCEHNLSNPDKYLDIVKNEAPSCTVVNTPWRGAISKRYKNEVHGDHKKPLGVYNYSYDGTNCVDSDVTKDKQTHSNAEVFFFWHPRLNLKWSMKDTTPRPQRKAYPTAELIRSVSWLHKDKGATAVSKKWLVKSHSDNHGPTNGIPDQKGDKLLIISPVRADAITLRANGEVIDRLPYYGPFSGGGYRYYSRSWGYQISRKARGLCEIWIGNKKYGGCNPAFRDPSYR